MVFLGDVDGKALMKEANPNKIAACRAAVEDWKIPSDFDLTQITIGGQPAIDLFQDRQTDSFHAFSDMT